MLIHILVSGWRITFDFINFNASNYYASILFSKPRINCHILAVLGWSKKNCNGFGRVQILKLIYQSVERQIASNPIKTTTDFFSLNLWKKWNIEGCAHLVHQCSCELWIRSILAYLSESVKVNQPWWLFLYKYPFSIFFFLGIPCAQIVGTVCPRC